MGLAAELEGVLKRDVMVPVKDGGIELRDRQSGMKVRIVIPPGLARLAAINVERVGHFGKLRDRGSERAGHLRRICDYLLIVESGDSTPVVFVELKETWSEEEKPRDQLRRSLPLLEYLRSVCEIEYERRPGEYGIQLHYWIIFEKHTRTLNRQPVHVDPARMPRVEEYNGITIRTVVGKSFPLTTLTGQR